MPTLVARRLIQQIPVKMLLISFGSVLLLSSFLTQQFIFEKWNGRLLQIKEADASFLAYQSNNHIFNAIFEIVPEAQKNRLRQLQLMNYQTALEQLWQELTPESKVSLAAQGVRRIGISAIVNARTSDQIKDMNATVQTQINFLISEFRSEQTKIEQKKQQAQLVFSALYIVGSLLLIIGNLAPAQKEGRP